MPLPNTYAREDMGREQDLKRVYLDFGIDSQGVFYRRLKPDQNLFEQTDSLGETPEQIRKALENPFFFGGSISVPESLDQKVPIPEGSWRSGDGKAYRDPGSPAQIARGLLKKFAITGEPDRATLTYNNVSQKERGSENFEYRKDTLIFMEEQGVPFVVVEREVFDDKKPRTRINETASETDEIFYGPNYWEDCNADYMVLDLGHKDGTNNRVVLQRIVVGEHQWTEVSQDL